MNYRSLWPKFIIMNIFWQANNSMVQQTIIRNMFNQINKLIRIPTFKLQRFTIRKQIQLFPQPQRNHNYLIPHFLRNALNPINLKLSHRICSFYMSFIHNQHWKLRDFKLRVQHDLKIFAIFKSFEPKAFFEKIFGCEFVIFL